jgi:hypothetical protein
MKMISFGFNLSYLSHKCYMHQFVFYSYIFYDIKFGCHFVKKNCWMLFSAKKTLYYAIAPTLFGMYFSMLLKHAYRDQESGISINSTQMVISTDGDQYAEAQSKTKIKKVLTRELLFADGSAIRPHSVQELQRILTAFF